MLALPVIKHFDVLEDLLLGLLSGLETAVMDQLSSGPKSPRFKADAAMPAS